MIHEAAERLSNRGFNVENRIEDSFGTIGYSLTFAGSRYCLVAKNYSYDGLASFMARLVNHAPEDMEFIFYCRDEDSYTVFDLQYIREHASPSEGSSKKRDCSWLEIDKSHGVDLDEYIRGESSPDRLSGKNSTLGNFAGSN